MAATAGKILVDGDGIQRRGCVGDEGNDPKTRVTAAATGCGNVTFEGSYACSDLVRTRIYRTEFDRCVYPSRSRWLCRSYSDVLKENTGKI